MNMTVFIVDDEAPARREMRYLLDQVEGVTIVGEASTPSQALHGIRENRPDLVFLDVQMPGLSGIELSEIIRELPDAPHIVFASAHGEFAVDAFNVEAVDYLLKPFTLDRVKQAIRKALKFVGESAPPSEHSSPAPDEQGQPTADVKKIPVNKGGRIIPLSPDAIVFIKCLDGETVVQTADETYKSKNTLGELEAGLKQFSFMRVHRNALVNIGCISEIIPWFNGSCKLIMNDRSKQEILVSRYHVRELKRRLLAT